MAVFLRIYADHNKNINQLWDIAKTLIKDQHLQKLLKLLDTYESNIGSSPVKGYNKWEKEYKDSEEFSKFIIEEGSAIIRNNVFTIEIAKKAFIINHWTKLGYFCDDIKLQDIFLEIIKFVTYLFQSTTAIFAADSAYKTELIAYKLYEGESIESILKWIKSKKIRLAVSISDIKKHSAGRYYETDACYIMSL